jgi:hypothetical protein
MLHRSGLLLEQSFDRWADGGITHSLSYGDRIAVIRKPAAADPS